MKIRKIVSGKIVCDSCGDKAKRVVQYGKDGDAIFLCDKHFTELAETIAKETVIA